MQFEALEQYDQVIVQIVQQMAADDLIDHPAVIEAAAWKHRLYIRQIPWVRIGRKRLVLRSQVLAWVERLQNPARPPPPADGDPRLALMARMGRSRK